MYAIQLSNGCRWDSSYLIRDKNYCEQALTIYKNNYLTFYTS